jgi:hypothetical protein
MKIESFYIDLGWYIVIVKNINSTAIVHKGTIPTEFLLLVGEVGANFCG